MPDTEEATFFKLKPWCLFLGGSMKVQVDLS